MGRLFMIICNLIGLAGIPVIGNKSCARFEKAWLREATFTRAGSGVNLWRSLGATPNCKVQHVRAYCALFRGGLLRVISGR